VLGRASKAAPGTTSADQALDTSNALDVLLCGRHLAASLPDRIIDSQPPPRWPRALRWLSTPVLRVWLHAATSNSFEARYLTFMRSYGQELCLAGRAVQPGLPSPREGR